jgi:hypothetical protein
MNFSELPSGLSRQKLKLYRIGRTLVIVLPLVNELSAENVLVIRSWHY